MFRVFGKDAVASADGKTVDRNKLGAIVFADAQKRKQLNSMTHGPIFVEILKQIFRLRVLKGEPLVVLDAPLLFETRILEHLCHPIIVVGLRDTHEQTKRLMERNKELSAEEAMKKIKSQMPLEVKNAKADIIVDNSGSRKDLERKLVAHVVPQILKELRLDYQ